MKLSIEEILEACKGELIKNVTGEKEFTFSTDTRNIKSGDIYIPLKGAKFDGENFIDNAIEKGASGCFTTKDNVEAPLVIKVPDTLKAYLELCRFYKDKQKTFTIGITGSSGKTTTKEMLFSVLSTTYKTHKTYLNHNNEIGLCQTFFTMPDDCEAVVVEMGMRNLGEIENADGIGEVGNAKCGDIMKIYLKVDKNIITDVKFETFGCGSAIASSSMATEMIKGKSIDEALKLSNKAVAEALDGLPAHKMHCSVLAEEAIKAAVQDYYNKIGIDYNTEEFPNCETCGHCCGKH